MFYTLETLYHKKINKIWILFISWVIPLTYKNIKVLNKHEKLTTDIHSKKTI